MEYLEIRNWNKWQTYRADRGQPPWIKIHRRLMRNPEWVSLSDAERGQLVGIWLLAADHDGVIPASKELIKKLCYMESDPNINKFIELGFINSNGVNSASTRRQDDQPEAKAEAKAETEKIFLSDSIEYRLSELLYSLILKNNATHKKPCLNKWAKNIDLMIRIDKRKPDEIESMIKWCQKDAFWHKNILSTGKLREKFDQLYLKMKPLQASYEIENWG